MARPGVAVPKGETRGDHGSSDGSRYELGAWEEGLDRWDEQFDYAASRDAVTGRRTVRISGQGAEAYASRNGTRPSAAERHRKVKPYERAGFRPDRVAMWAVLLGVLLILAATTSSHAAVLAAHHALTLR